MSIDPTLPLPVSEMIARRWSPLSPFRALALRDANKAPIEIGHNRLIVTATLFGVAFAVIAARLVDVTLLGMAVGPHLAHAPKAYQAARADIVDRNGVLIATSLATQSVYAEPKKIGNPAEVAKKLAAVLPELKPEVILARLTSDKSFVYIKRNLTPRQQWEVNRLGVPGLSFQPEDRRIYPQGSELAHVLGFSDVDNHGLAGIEKSFDERLRASAEPLQLSIDVRVQHIVREELAAAIQKFQGIGGAGMVMDSRTGEMLAMVSLPDFDPNEPGAATDDARFNRDTLGVYEMGSTFKIFTAAMALDAGTATLNSSFDATNPIQISRFTISDYHAKKRWLTVPEIFIYSSNVGAAKMALEVGATGQRAFMEKVGLLHTPKFELPELGHPHIPMPWRPINVMTVAFGHGISVSALQTVAAANAVIDGGIMVPPTLIKRQTNEPVAGQQVVSFKTSMLMRKLMHLNVEAGSGRKGEVPGYEVGAKTGTAEKIGAGGYAHKSLLSSFLSTFPSNDPRYVVLMIVDEPHGTKETFGNATAAYVAAPASANVIARIGPLLGIAPVDENSPEMRRLMTIDPANGGPRVATE
jgi:cell division protein FtsI (penicillin-binding protein 3)